MVKLEDIFENKNNIKIILDYLKNKNEKCIILRGYIGCGKTTLIQSCLEHMNYDCVIYDTEEDYDNIDIVGKIKMTLTGNGMDKLFGLKPKAIIIKDIDNSLKVTQKNELYNFLKKTTYKTTPLFITTNDNLIGTIRDIPKEIKQLDFEPPKLKDLLMLFSYSNITKKHLTEIIEKSNYDIRQIKFILENLKDIKDIKNNTFGIKDIELDTFNSIDYCFEQHSIDEKLTYCTIYTDYTIFQNYPKLCTDINDLNKIINLCVSSDEIVKYVYEYNIWDNLYESSHILGTIGPINIIKKKTKKLEYPSSNINNINNIRNNNNELSIFNDPLLIKLLINKYKYKLIDEKEYKKELSKIKDPIKAFKLGFFNINKKEIKEYKKNLSELKRCINNY